MMSTTSIFHRKPKLLQAVKNINQCENYKVTGYRFRPSPRQMAEKHDGERQDKQVRDDKLHMIHDEFVHNRPRCKQQGHDGGTKDELPEHHGEENGVRPPINRTQKTRHPGQAGDERQEAKGK